MNDLFNPLNGFQSRKAAQIAAYFTTCAAHSGKMLEKLKLIKLMYLSEREFMLNYDRPMIYDEFYSLKDGPICSGALNGINGIIDKSVWEEYIVRNGNMVSPVKAAQRDMLDELSDAEFDNLAGIWARFGGMTPSQIRNYTHDKCPEYKEVFSGRSPITYTEVFHALGSRDAGTLASGVEEFREFESAIRRADDRAQDVVQTGP